MNTVEGRGREWMRKGLLIRYNGESAPFLPYRLIDVQPSSPLIVYSQVERDQEDLDWIPNYVALSYCWGGKNAVQLKLSRAFSGPEGCHHRYSGPRFQVSLE